jgi:hypothetical protein
MLDDLVSQWLDEYGTSVHPIPAFSFETRAVSSHVEALADAQYIGAQFDSDFQGYSDEYDRLDELYDEQFLGVGLWEPQRRAGYFDPEEAMQCARRK